MPTFRAQRPDESTKDYYADLNAKNKEINAHNANLYKDDDRYIFEGTPGGQWRAIPKCSENGKAILAERKATKDAAKLQAEIKENAVQEVIEILEDEDNVTKIMIRSELNKIGAFTVENLEKIAAELI